jgi:hypothetical protein
MQGLPLKAGNYADETVGKVSSDLARRDISDFGLGVEAIGQDTSLGTREGNSLSPDAVYRHSGEGNGGLFAGGEQDV